MKRREFLARSQCLGASGLGLALAGAVWMPDLARAASDVKFDDFPFALGVASGYPRPDGFSLWTRIVTRPLEPRGGLSDSAYHAVLKVRYQIALDARFSKVVSEGEAYADQSFAHSIHIDLFNLSPGTRYFYRFLIGDAVSTVGSTKTAPALDADVAEMRIALASCSHYEQGYFANYRAMANDECDLMIHVGDYIYESSWGQNRVRSHGAPEPMTLDDYRIRHALYRTDPDLQLAHASAPWLLTWDDHEVDNDYAAAISQDDDSRSWFLARRRAAYQAFYEHMPLPRSMVPMGNHMKIYAGVQFGKLANFFVLDNRQYREGQPCPPGHRRGGNQVSNESCPERSGAPRSMLGSAQERWLGGQLSSSQARWNLLTQQTLLVSKDAEPGAGKSLATDGWDGYPQARAQLLEQLAKTSNPVVIGGDLHAFHVADVHLDQGPKMRKSPLIASEVVGTSITSQAWPNEKLQAELPDNPHIHLANSSYRGYTRLEISQKSTKVVLLKAEDVRDPQTKISPLAEFRIEDQRPGPKAI